MTTKRQIREQIEKAEADHPDFRFTTYPGKGASTGLTIFHTVHVPTGLETTRDSPSINGALWCVTHFEETKADPRFWGQK